MTVRLLLSEEFFGRIEWALNGFLNRSSPATAGGSGAWRKASSRRFLPREQLKAGVEMQFRSFTDKGIRGTPCNSFVIGPTVGCKPTRNIRIDVAPLFGVNHKSPQVQAFVVRPTFSVAAANTKRKRRPRRAIVSLWGIIP